MEFDWNLNWFWVNFELNWIELWSNTIKSIKYSIFIGIKWHLELILARYQWHWWTKTIEIDIIVPIQVPYQLAGFKYNRI